MIKYVFVTGGVVSGLGKGITVASLGHLLKARGLRIVAQKLDPYINIDPGTMSPYQHGEVFVTEDGAETDLDLGHYERFIDENLNKYSNLTTGKVYWNVLKKERTGEYLGDTIQVIPHITDEIKKFVYSVGKKSTADVVITEIGGTVGDIESGPFLEAARQIFLEVAPSDCIFIHVTLVPYIESSKEYKSKPTQHSVKELRVLGISPDIIVTRCSKQIDEDTLRKISMFCNVKPDCVIDNTDVDTIYKVPLALEKSDFSNIVCRELKLNCKEADLTDWSKMVDRISKRVKSIKIALIGKYVRLHDAYLSVVEALNHAGCENGINIIIKWIDSNSVTKNLVEEFLRNCDGIIVPGGFGDRGIEGKITVIEYARRNNIPFLGICLGMQVAAIEFARNVLNIRDANSREFSENCEACVIDLMMEQHNKLQKGGTMRLGAYPCKILQNTKLIKTYGKSLVSERHRHRYEFNNKFRAEFEEAGVVFSGVSPDGLLVEALEIPENDFFVGVQFHPEFKSRPNRTHPLFFEFIKRASSKISRNFASFAMQM
ncbi:MAG: CTP synthase [Oscillospiraceae bacterium]|jgi:CTP synthase|nr:CTP synthase [Oscillospiraceae bacterium]